MKTRLAYLVLPPLLIGTVSVLLPPLLWFTEFLWSWLVSDNVIPVGRFERSVWNGSRPLEAFSGGAAFGLLVSGIFMAMRWYGGRWPHEQ
jgi:hypothetical protein